MTGPNLCFFFLMIEKLRLSTAGKFGSSRLSPLLPPIILFWRKKSNSNSLVFPFGCFFCVHCVSSVLCDNLVDMPRFSAYPTCYF